MTSRYSVLSMMFLAMIANEGGQVLGVVCFDEGKEEVCVSECSGKNR
jgi:hypothetical protein